MKRKVMTLLHIAAAVVAVAPLPVQALEVTMWGPAIRVHRFADIAMDSDVRYFDHTAAHSYIGVTDKRRWVSPVAFGDRSTGEYAHRHPPPCCWTPCCCPPDCLSLQPGLTTDELDTEQFELVLEHLIDEGFPPLGIHQPVQRSDVDLSDVDLSDVDLEEFRRHWLADDPEEVPDIPLPDWLARAYDKVHFEVGVAGGTEFADSINVKVWGTYDDSGEYHEDMHVNGAPTWGNMSVPISYLSTENGMKMEGRAVGLAESYSLGAGIDVHADINSYSFDASNMGYEDVNAFHFGSRVTFK